MKDELISYETAKLAKEKGFNIPQPKCCIRQKDGGRLLTEMWSDSLNEFDVMQCYQPTQALLQRWIREIKKININCMYQLKIGGYFYGVVELAKAENCKLYNTYEEALEAGLINTLKLIK